MLFSKSIFVFKSIIIVFSFHLLGLCYSEVVTRFPKGGSAYSYAYATTGELLAFLVGWGMVLEYSIGTALAAKAFSQYLDVVLDGRLSQALQYHLGNLNIRGLDDQLDFPSVAVTLLVAILLVISVKVSKICTEILTFCLSLNEFRF